VFCAAVEQQTLWDFDACTLFQKQVPSLQEDYLYSDTSQDYCYFPSQMFEAFPAQIPMFSEKMFHCLILSQAITLKLICGLGFFPLACSANAPLLNVRS